MDGLHHIDNYRKNIKNAEPVGAFTNNQWANFTLGHCGDDDDEAMETGALAIKEFFGPNRPYTADRADVYERLLRSRLPNQSPVRLPLLYHPQVGAHRRRRHTGWLVSRPRGLPAKLVA